jgi:hypothetical protein
MSNIRRQHELLRDECKRRAEAAWLRAMRSDLTEVERRDALDQAHALMIVALKHAETVAAAADVRPVKFTRRNAGPQNKTRARAEFVRALADANAGAKRQVLALAVWNHPDASQHFENYEAVYRFLGRGSFI